MCALEAGFSEAVKESYRHILEAFHSIGTGNSGDSFSVESLGNITLWKALFETYVANLRLDIICDAVVKAIDFAVSYTIGLFLEDDFLCTLPFFYSLV